MSDLLAPPAISLRRRSTLEMLALDPALELGAGGEARVLAVPGDDSLVAKLYHEPTLAKARKVALMMEEPPELDASAARLAWPCDLLFDGSGAFAGFLMPRAEGSRVFELYNPVTRRQTAPHADYAFLHRVAANVAAAFEALHARGYVIGDVNESNVLVRDDGRITLVDTDSMQVRDPEDGAVHRSRVGKPEFTPPELQGRSFADFDRSPEHDRFGLAVLLFLLLMEGTHPFAGRLDDGGEMPPIEERIRRGLFPHHGHAEIDPPRLAPEFELLGPAIRALFVRAFVEGHADPAARPSAAEWRAALGAAADALVVCGKSARHRHGPHLRECPWCERTAVLRGRDPFPADAPPERPRSKAVRAPAPRALAAPARKPRVPVTRLVPAPARPASTALSPGAPAPLPKSAGKEWIGQALGKTGLLHPGAWIAPSLVMMFGPPGLVAMGRVIFPIALVMALMRLWKPHPERRYPATFAVPAAVMLLLALWIVVAMDGSTEAYTPSDAPVPEPVSAPARPAPAPNDDDGTIVISAEGWQVRLGAPTMDGDSLVMSNWGEAQRDIGRPYVGSTHRQVERVLLVVYVLPDGTVDPARIRTYQVSDSFLEDMAVAEAPEMRFEFPDAIAPREGWVQIEVTYGPWPWFLPR